MAEKPKSPPTRYDSPESKALRKNYDVKVVKSGDATLDELMSSVAKRVNNDPRYKKAVNDTITKKKKK